MVPIEYLPDMYLVLSMGMYLCMYLVLLGTDLVITEYVLGTVWYMFLVLAVYISGTKVLAGCAKGTDGVHQWYLGNLPDVHSVDRLCTEYMYLVYTSYVQSTYQVFLWYFMGMYMW